MRCGEVEIEARMGVARRPGLTVSRRALSGVTLIGFRTILRRRNLSSRFARKSFEANAEPLAK
jgi:hypothetical protein